MPATMTCHACEWANAMNRNPAIPATAATMRTGRAPNRSMNLPLTNAMRNPRARRATGRPRWPPVPSRRSRNPLPPLVFGRTESNRGMRSTGPSDEHGGEVGQQNRAPPSIAVETSGCLARRSHIHQPTSTTTPPAAQPSVAGDVQPHDCPWVSDSRTADRPDRQPDRAEPVDRPGDGCAVVGGPRTPRSR